MKKLIIIFMVSSLLSCKAREQTTNTIKDAVPVGAVYSGDIVQSVIKRLFRDGAYPDAITEVLSNNLGRYAIEHGVSRYVRSEPNSFNVSLLVLVCKHAAINFAQNFFQEEPKHRIYLNQEISTKVQDMFKKKENDSITVKRDDLFELWKIIAQRATEITYYNGLLNGLFGSDAQNDEFILKEADLRDFIFLSFMSPGNFLKR